MSNFHPFRHRGLTYDFYHLENHMFDVETDGGTYRVRADYSHHVFTESLADETAPDLRYRHNNETRAFCFVRYELSKSVPALLESQERRQVYNSNRQSFFIAKDTDGVPYYVFFRCFQARKKSNAHVRIEVASAYLKPNMISQAPAVKFTTLIEKTARGEEIKLPKPSQVRFRNG